MSPALDDLPVRKVIQAPESAGFAYVRTKGSHAVYRDREGRVAVIPQHGVVKRGTLASILRQAGLTVRDGRPFPRPRGCGMTIVRSDPAGFAVDWDWQRGLTVWLLTGRRSKPTGSTASCSTLS